MRPVLIVLALVAVALPATAADLGNRIPEKPLATTEPPPPDPEVLRQGGDTIADAVEIELGYSGTGTTAGYTDDYDEVCPYANSTSPDVVYTFMFQWDMNVRIDMLGSSYDTKIYVYDENLNLVACNDDYYPDYVSFIDNLLVEGGVRYYLVIDGYGGDFGDYVLDFTDIWGDHLHCPPGATLEGEPPLEIDYIDTFNGGCNTDPLDPPFQHINDLEFCGISGFYLFEGSNYRDTDWFTVTLPASGVIELNADGELATFVFELGPQDCDQVGVLQQIQVGPFNTGWMIVTGEPGTDVWLWVGPTTFTAPDGSYVYEYEYVMLFTGAVGMEDHSWSSVKSLFD